MSGIGGIYSIDKPVNPELLARMRDIISHRGPDGSGLWVKENVGFIHRLLWTTEESVYEKQPLTHGQGLWITADCRIDNRDELRREFEAHGVWMEMKKNFDSYFPPDSAFILWAYQIWGEDAPSHLLGDFAFAIWDEQNQKLFCTRDPLGLKPFVYYWDGKKFLFASDAKQIFQDSSIPTDLNIVHLAELTALGLSNSEDTPYQAIRRLPPAHSMTIKHERLQIKKWWLWDPREEPLSTASLEENAEIFLHLFKEAVRARLRVPPGLRRGATLSGGLDSSSIVSMAAGLFRENSRFNKADFPVFTAHLPEADSAYQSKNKDPVDENTYSTAVVEKYDLESHRIEIKGWGPLENFEENIWHQEGPLFFPAFAFSQYFYNQLSGKGVRVLLHGEGGDELFFVPRSFGLGDFRKGGFLEFFGEFSKMGEILNVSRFGLLKVIARSSIPLWIKRARQYHERKSHLYWINPKFAKRNDFYSRVCKDLIWDPSFQTSSFASLLVCTRSPHVASYREALNRAQSASSLEIRFPFWDIRLIRFAASLPLIQKSRGGVTKILLREAMKDLLPNPVLNRLRKSEFTPAYLPAFEKYAAKEIKETYENPNPLLNSFVQSEKIRPFFNECFGSNGLPLALKKSRRPRWLWWHGWYLVNLDQWLKRRQGFLSNERSAFYEIQKEKFREVAKS